MLAPISLAFTALLLVHFIPQASLLKYSDWASNELVQYNEQSCQNFYVTLPRMSIVKICTETDLVSSLFIEPLALEGVERCKEVDRQLVVSPHTLHQQLAEQEQGPDTFYLIVDGPSQRMGTNEAKYLGNCSYQISIPLIPGPLASHELSLYHLYGNYSGFDDLITESPVLEKRLVLHLTLPKRDTPIETADKAVLQLLEANLPGPGYWLNATQWPVTNLNCTGSALYEQFTWFSSRRSSELCHHSASTWLEASNRTAVFTGDSQMRYTYIAFGKQLQNIIQKTARQKFQHDAQDLEHLRLIFEHDVFLEELLKRDETWWSLVDIIYFDIGHWPAAGESLGGHWTTEKYVERLHEVAKHLQKVRSSRKRALSLEHNSSKVMPSDLVVVFQGIMAIPLPKSSRNQWFVDTKDWRTQQRFRYWDKLSKQIMANYSIPVVDAFGISTPYAMYSPDQAHYYGTDVEVALVEETLATFCDA